jgi:hypothetical protein
MNKGRKWTIAAIIVIAILVGGYFALTAALNRFVQNGKLAELIGKKTGVKLEADAGYLPFIWRGMSIRSDGLLVRGKPPRALTVMQAANLRAHCSLKNLWQREWTITRLQASHLQAAFGSAASTQIEHLLARDPQLQPQIETPSPLNLDIKETFIPRTDVFWGETPEAIGSVRDVETRFYPKDKNLDIFGRGGTFVQTGWPQLKVDTCRLNYTKPKLIVQSALFSLGRPKNFTLTGGWDFGENGGMNLHLRSVETPAEPFLKGYWQGKLEAVFESETDLTKRSGTDEKVNARGEIRFKSARVHDVAVLKQVAVVTRHPQFEAPRIDVFRFRYNWNGTRLEVTEFESETKGLFRIEGSFAIENDQIEGKLRVGAAPDVVDSLPGAREKVFTESRNGFLWTPMTLEGPLHHPREDLKRRLVDAAKEHFSKGLLAPLFKPGKAVIEGLNAIYN